MVFDIIGAGRVGKTFGKYLSSKGHKINHVVNSSLDSSKKAVEFIGDGVPSSIDEIGGCDVLLIGVNDDRIRQIFLGVKDKISGVKAVGHFSGAYPSSILRECDEMEIGRFSIHPNASFANPRIWEKMNEIHFVMDGNRKGKEIIRELFGSLGIRFSEIAEEKKIFYHVAAVFASNFVVGIQEISNELYSMAGLDSETAREISIFLSKQAIENVQSLGIKGALTGPVVRGDRQLVEAERMTLMDLDPDIGILYGKFAQILRERVIKTEHSQNSSDEG
ncbi:MAG: hypothetical protein C0176_03580 [Mesoaciditoga sp.]|uniref:Rossmann-like and DUF2520 domain-containing protein n=1 Tax=Athalassotoga sp. TaxID=2022597 RepID=UPI000CBD65A6|nr:MAG: hypothetical protein C0176_03580 [Mesoaciditoga sp.]HEU24781.1 DUF2520 domain-containing protein [Mesoaciditoga lauensis]